MASPIKKVIVVGASGNIGTTIISSLLENKFDVSALTRSTSKATFPSTVTVIRTDYTTASLIEAFKGQDAVVSTIATFSTGQQASIVNAAVNAGVRRFIPSEYGVDTSLPQVKDVLSIAMPKQRTIELLKTKEASGLSWTGVIVGGFFDWAFAIPGLMGWDLPGRKVTIFDGGDVQYEATTMLQIGRTVAALLTAEHEDATKNKYIYVNSFTVTQNKVLNILEELTGDKFAVTHATRAALVKTGQESYSKAIAEGNTGDGDYVPGAMEMITAQILDNDGLNKYSKRRGLWNDKLGLPKEDLKTVLTQIVENAKNRQG